MKRRALVTLVVAVLMGVGGYAAAALESGPAQRTEMCVGGGEDPWEVIARERAAGAALRGDVIRLQEEVAFLRRLMIERGAEAEP